MSLQLVYALATSLSWMQSQGPMCLFSLDILVGWGHLPFQKMGPCLYLEVMTQLSNCGTCRLVGLSGPSLTIPTISILSPFPRTAPPLLQEIGMGQFMYGTL